MAVRRGTPFDIALEQGLRALGEADRRLAHELAAGVLRHEAALDAAIAPLLARGPGSVLPPVQDILRLGAYQLRHLDRVPPHAVVATAVELTRAAVGEKGTGFVNAVLRRMARERSARAATPTDAATLAAASSHPEWLVARWLERFGLDDTTRLLEWNNTQPALVVQATDGDLDALQRMLSASGSRTFPAPYGAGLVVESTRPDRLPGFEAGRFFVQDPAQALVVRWLGATPRDTVFDACAAPGGKTIGMAASARFVVAADAARRRLPRLRENLRRVGNRNVAVLLADAAHPPIRPVDRVLLDAPCLGTGTFARHPDARLRVTPEGLARLAREQALLLDALAERVGPGGVLCYATCSLEVEENAAQIEAFLTRHPAFRRDPPAGDFPRNAAGDLESLPHRDGMDGAYAARLVRTGPA